VITNIETAELIKYAANSFLATKISFINEMANLCEKVGADIHDVARGMGLDMRIGKKFLHAGAGFGGSCFPKDTRALMSLASEYGTQMSVVSAAVDANDRQKRLMLQKITSAMGAVDGKTVAVIGLSFKPNTDDIREAPALYLIDELLKQGCRIRACDPVSIDNARKLFPGVHYARDAYEAVEGADAAVLVTEWNQFRNLDLEKIRTAMRTPLFFDLRNVYETGKMRDAGFTYYSVGRPQPESINKSQICPYSR
jgi:UDPglucose 6-dehydrogenase